MSVGPLQVLQLAEELRLALELQVVEEDRTSLRSQLPCSTAQTLMDWLERGLVSSVDGSHDCGLCVASFTDVGIFPFY